MDIELGIDGGTPYGDIVVGHDLLQILQSLLGPDDAGEVHGLGFAAGQEGAVADLHALAGGQHRIGNDEGGIIEFRSGEIVDMDGYFCLFAVSKLAVGTNECGSGLVKDIEKSLMEGESSTEDGA